MCKQLEDQVYEKVAWCIEQFNHKTNSNFPPFITVKFNIKGRVAGYANGFKMHIELNNDLLNKYQDKFIQDTVVHEMAHLFAYYQNKYCAAHGSDWYQIMRLLGHKSPSRCHDMETKPARKMRKFKYKCDCGRDHQVSNIKHKRIMNGSSYSCVHCKTRIWRDK